MFDIVDVTSCRVDQKIFGKCDRDASSGLKRLVAGPEQHQSSYTCLECPIEEFWEPLSLESTATDNDPKLTELTKLVKNFVLEQAPLE